MTPQGGVMNFTQRLLLGVASVGLAAAGALGLNTGAPVATEAQSAFSGSTTLGPPAAGTAAHADTEAAVAATGTHTSTTSGWRIVSAGDLLSNRPTEITARVSARSALAGLHSTTSSEKTKVTA